VALWPFSQGELEGGRGRFGCSAERQSGATADGRGWTISNGPSGEGFPKRYAESIPGAEPDGMRPTSPPLVQRDIAELAEIDRLALNQAQTCQWCAGCGRKVVCSWGIWEGPAGRCGAGVLR
jgi:hypothetical protein